MTIGTFKTIKRVVIGWMILLGLGSIMLFMDGEDQFIYAFQVVLSIITIWFLNQIGVKGEKKQEESGELELK